MPKQAKQREVRPRSTTPAGGTTASLIVQKVDGREKAGCLLAGVLSLVLPSGDLVPRDGGAVPDIEDTNFIVRVRA